MRYSVRAIDIAQFSSFGTTAQYHTPLVRKELGAERSSEFQSSVHGNLVGHIIGVIVGDKVSDVIKG